MKKMLKCLCMVIALVGGTVIASAACSGCATHKAEMKGMGEELCTNCGEMKGSEKCCKPAMKCDKCGMHKGAPGCCKMEKGEKMDKTCGMCGEMKGSEKCSKPEMKCEKGGMDKEASSCNKMEKGKKECDSHAGKSCCSMGKCDSHK